jgi:hypothetical protein
MAGTAGSEKPGPASSLAADELLPPIEAPSGAFLLQLFVIPAVIVAAVVGLWLLVNSLVNRGATDPQAIVGVLRSSSQARFQKAKELADMLRMDQQYPHLKEDHELAGALADMLDTMRESGDEGESAVTMRWIVCGALGQFHVDDGLPALIGAARKDPDKDVRRKAIGAIATLSQSLQQLDPPQALEHPELVPTLVALANQADDDLVRSETAFALGVLAKAPDADPAYLGELELLLEDFYPDARYNAATGLARLGDLRSIPTIIEMLDLDSIVGSVEGEQPFNEQVSQASLARQRGEKRDLILVNALKAVASLREGHSAQQLMPLRTAVEGFVTRAPGIDQPTKIPQSLIKAAEQVLATL